METAELFKKIELWKQQQSVTAPDSSSYRAWQKRIDAAQARLNELCPEERVVAQYKADLVAANSESEYQALCNSENCDQTQPHPMSDHINVIIPGLLYLGDSVVASNRSWLVAHNIQAIVNMAEVDGVITNHEELEGRYLSFKVDDHYNAMQQIELCFERAKEFLLQHHGQKTAVLVHCKQGISRSSTLVIAYLMHLNKWSLRQAMDVVKAARKKVAPNGGFMRALLQMEYALHGNQSMEEKDFPEPLELGFQELKGQGGGGGGGGGSVRVVIDPERRKSLGGGGGSNNNSNSSNSSSSCSSFSSHRRNSSTGSTGSSNSSSARSSPVSVCVIHPPYSPPPLMELRESLSDDSEDNPTRGGGEEEKMDTSPTSPTTTTAAAAAVAIHTTNFTNATSSSSSSSMVASPILTTLTTTTPMMISSPVVTTLAPPSIDVATVPAAISTTATTLQGIHLTHPTTTNNITTSPHYASSTPTNENNNIITPNAGVVASTVSSYNYSPFASRRSDKSWQ